MFRLFIVVMLGSGLSLSVSKETVAIVGGGYAGLACGVKFAGIAGCKEIHIYDALGPGKALSSAASGGIMHPMAPRGNVIWNGREGMSSSYALMNSAQSVRPDLNIYNKEVRLNRPIFTEKDYNSWLISASKNPELVEFSDEYASDEELAFGQPRAIAQILDSAIVNSPAYLEALWSTILKYSAANGVSAKWKSETVHDLMRLAEIYDTVIVACGAGALTLCKEGGNMADDVRSKRIQDMRLIRGQHIFYDYEPLGTLRQRGPQQEGRQISAEMVGLPRPNEGLLCGEYVIPSYSHGIESDMDIATNVNTTSSKELDRNSSTYARLMCGSTHEYITPEQFDTMYASGQANVPDVSVAKDLLLSSERVRNMCPGLLKLKPSGGNAGVKIATQRGRLGRLPIVGRYPMASVRSTGTSSSSSSSSSTNSSIANNLRMDDRSSGIRRDGKSHNNIWLITGFGSRGLIHHALMADWLHQAILHDDESIIPSCLHPGGGSSNL